MIYLGEARSLPGGEGGRVATNNDQLWERECARPIRDTLPNFAIRHSKPARLREPPPARLCVPAAGVPAG
jgi:hypothetical protein